MNNKHPISEDFLDYARISLLRGNRWMAYNRRLYFIEKHDVHFFNSQAEAIEFAKHNFIESDSSKVIHVNSLREILEEIPDNDTRKTELIHDPDINGLINKEGDEFTDALIEHFEQQQLLFNSQLKTNVMNTDNFQYLSDNIKYMGFGENLKPELERNLNENQPDFQLHFKAEINKKPFEATLNFRKSETTDMYFFNNYRGSLEKGNGEKMEQTFYLNKGKGVTAKEAFNLLDGRAVQKDLVTKEGQAYKAWVQLDPGNNDKNNNFDVKQFHENYGFDLKAAVEKFAIAELKDPEKQKTLLQSLQKGNVQSVNIEKDGNTQKMFIEADPQFKKLKLFDAEMKPVQNNSIDQYKSVAHTEIKIAGEEVANDKKKELKQEIKPEKDQSGKKNNQSLLPKKRTHTKKSLGVS